VRSNASKQRLVCGGCSQEGNGFLFIHHAREEKEEGAIRFSENRGSNVREEGCHSDSFQVGTEGGSRGEESAFSSREGRGMSHKDLTIHDRDRLSRCRGLGLATLLSLSARCSNLGVVVGGFGG